MKWVQFRYDIIWFLVNKGYQKCTVLSFRYWLPKRRWQPIQCMFSVWRMGSLLSRLRYDLALSILQDQLLLSGSTWWLEVDRYCQLDFVKQGPVWEDDSHLASQKIPCLLLNIEVHWHVHLSVLLIRVMILINLVHVIVTSRFCINTQPLCYVCMFYAFLFWSTLPVYATL